MFKKILLTAILLAIFGVKQNYLHAQIFFTETFEGTMGANGIPTGWSETGLSNDGIYNVGTNANASSPYVTFPAAIQGTKFAYTNDDACNCNKSVDRLILPVQSFAGMAGVTMIYDVFNDGLYGGIGTVEVSTTGTTGPWTTVSTISTNATWQNDISLSLGAYAGQSNIFIAFRYNDAAQWAGAFGVDEIRLQQLTVLTPEVSVTSVTPSEYSLIPKDQASSFPVSATIANSGSGAAASVTLTTKVFRLPNTTTPVYQQIGTASNLASGASTTINLSAFTPSFPTVGDYIFQHVITGNTGSILNDTLIYGTSIVPSFYARDNGISVQGIGAGNTTNVIIGNNYAINTPAVLDSVLFYLYPGAAGLGDTVRVRIRNTVAGVPQNTADVAFSAPYVLTAQDTAATIITLNIINASATPVLLSAGTYFVGIEKYLTGDNYGLQCSASNFTQNTVYANLNGGAFTPLNSLLAGFNFTPIIRPRFQTCSTAATATHVACGSFTWLNGQTYTSNNNTATYTMPSVEGCDSIITLNLTINPIDNPAFSYTSNTICTTGSNPTATTSSIGQFTSTAGLIFANATTGEIDLATSQTGTYTVTYTTTGICPETSSQTVTLTSSPSANFSYNNTDYCSGASTPQLTFGNGASAGVFTALPAGLVINPASGAIDLVNSLPNLYTVNNTIAASGACPQTSATFNITVTAPILGDFSYDNAAYCIDANNPQLTLGNGASAGVFSALPAGLVINPTSGAIDLVNSLPNLYTVSNTIAAAGVCPQTSSTITLTVNALPQVGLTLVDNVVCIDLATVSLQGGTPINGVYSGNNVTGNTFNTSTIGFTDITYTYIDMNGCSNTAVASIEAVDCANLEELADGNGIICYPNPADQQFTIEFLQPNGQDVQIEIINGMGQLIQHVEHSSIENNKITVYTENLATGLYTVRVRSGNELMTKLIQKM
jgi:hypothetical protein